MRWLRFIIGGICLLDVMGAAPTLPRYSFQVGRQLSYSGQSDFKYDGGSFASITSMELTVVGKNADGSFRILVRIGNTEAQNRGSATTRPAVSDENVTYSQADIFPDGRVASIVGGINPEPPFVLPPLPIDDKELATTWQRESKMPGSTTIFRSASAAPDGQFVLAGSTEGIFKTIYGMVSESSCRFDLQKGAVTSIETHDKQDYGFHGAGAGNISLDSDQTLPQDQVDSLSKDAATMFAAESEMSAQFKRTDFATENATHIGDQIKATFTAAEAKVTDPQIKTRLEKEAAEMPREIQYEMESARRIAEITNKPAFDFSTNDVNGQPHKLGDYHGKVLVLDFWYRGCGWCMRAMPQMKQVVEDFKGKPVVVLGMNTDQNVADANFVIDAMKLNYQTLKIDFAVAANFKVQGFPSLLIIDGNGIVRHFEEGYSPTLRADLDKKIQAILDAPASTISPAS